MSNAGVKLDDDLLAHMALHHLPDSHSTTKQVIIATSEASNIALTVTGVLSQINELVKDNDTPTPIPTALNTRANSKSSSYEKCSNGSHNPKTAHSADACWQLHPDQNSVQQCYNHRQSSFHLGQDWEYLWKTHLRYRMFSNNDPRQKDVLQLQHS